MRYLLVLLLIISASVGAVAETATTDKPDARLDQKVTLDVSHAKLGDVCKQLSEMTGVSIRAGNGERDWKVRERKVTIHAKDIRLGSLMKEISRLLGFYLSKSGREGEWAYLYWQDKKSRDLEAEMLSAEKEAAARKLTEKRQAMLDAAEKALKMTPEEAAKAKKDDPLTAYMADTKSGRGFAQLLSGLASQFPLERDLMLRGKRASIPIDSLPADLLQAALDTTTGGIIAGEQKALGREFPGDLSPCRITVMPIDIGSDYEAGLFGLCGAIIVNGVRPGGDPNAVHNDFGPGEPMSLFVLADPDSPVSKLLGEAFQMADDGVDAQEIDGHLKKTAGKQEFLAEVLAQDSPTEKDPPTDPRLMREIEITEEIPAASMTQAINLDEHAQKAVSMIAEAIGRPVLLESFARLLPPGGYIRKGKQPLYKILIAFEKSGYTWELSDGEILRIRPHNWALRRSFEIPESYLARYKSILDKQGEYTLDDIAMIAAELTDDQITRTLITDPEMRDVLSNSLAQPGAPVSQRTILRFYHSLNARQKSALGSEDGLAFADLTGEQWEHIGQVIADKLGGVYVQDGSIRMESVEADEKAVVTQNNFEIVVQIEGQESPSRVKESVARWRKSQVERFRKTAEEPRKAAEEQKKQAEPAK